ncbi:MAG: hypothetical protein ACJZ59_07800 [Candidatus Thalassarchaeaceae archaeon]
MFLEMVAHYYGKAGVDNDGDGLVDEDPWGDADGDGILDDDGDCLVSQCIILTRIATETEHPVAQATTASMRISRSNGPHGSSQHQRDLPRSDAEC